MIDAFKKENKISKRKKSLQTIKEEADSLPEISRISKNFEKSCFSPIKNIHKSLPKDKSKAVKDSVFELGRHHSTLHSTEKINDNISVLAYYLTQLKVNTLKKDDELQKRILNKFLKNHTNLNSTISMAHDFSKLIEHMENHYERISEVTSDELELSVKVNDINHRRHIDSLRELNNKQKELLFCIGKEFINLTRDKKK